MVWYSVCVCVLGRMGGEGGRLLWCVALTVHVCAYVMCAWKRSVPTSSPTQTPSIVPSPAPTTYVHTQEPLPHKLLRLTPLTRRALYQMLTNLHTTHAHVCVGRYPTPNCDTGDDGVSNLFVIEMRDDSGDGWSGTTFVILQSSGGSTSVVTSGTLVGGSQGLAYVCMQDGQYEFVISATNTDVGLCECVWLCVCAWHVALWRGGCMSVRVQCFVVRCDALPCSVVVWCRVHKFIHILQHVLLTLM